MIHAPLVSYAIIGAATWLIARFQFPSTPAGDTAPQLSGVSLAGAHYRGKRGVKSPITGKVFPMPPQILEGTAFDEENAVLIRDIPMNSITMLESQGAAILRDIQRGELSRTKGLPILWYDLSKEQLIIEDGNHRIFQKWLTGQDTFDAFVYSSDWSNYLRSVNDDEDIFRWSDNDRK